jgi:hypothetical protein
MFFQQFYVPLGAHLRKVVPTNQLGRASTLASLVAVGSIPITQFAFGLVLETARSFALSPDAQFRLAFLALGVTILLSGFTYSYCNSTDDV